MCLADSFLQYINVYFTLFLKEDLRSHTSSHVISQFEIEHPATQSDTAFPEEFFLIVNEFNTPMNVSFQRIQTHHMNYPVLENDVYLLDEYGMPAKHSFHDKEVSGN